MLLLQMTPRLPEGRFWNSSLELPFPGPAASTKAWLVVLVYLRVCNSGSGSDVIFFSSTVPQPFVGFPKGRCGGQGDPPQSWVKEQACTFDCEVVRNLISMWETIHRPGGVYIVFARRVIWETERDSLNLPQLCVHTSCYLCMAQLALRAASDTVQFGHWNRHWKVRAERQWERSQEAVYIRRLSQEVGFP